MGNDACSKQSNDIGTHLYESVPKLLRLENYTELVSISLRKREVALMRSVEREAPHKLDVTSQPLDDTLTEGLINQINIFKYFDNIRQSC